MALVAAVMAVCGCQPSGIYGIPDFTDDGGVDCQALGISSDGLAVAGYTTSASGRRMTRWTFQPQFTGALLVSGLAVDDFAGGPAEGEGIGISKDGQVLVGFGNSAAGQESAMWHASPSNPMATLGDLAGGPVLSAAHATSADGSVIVGFGSTADGHRAYRWTPATGLVSLGDLGGSFSRADGVSPDGAVVVGRTRFASGDEVAFRWTQSGGMLSLGDLAGGDVYSAAYAVSADGSTVVGQATTANGLQPFRWTAATGMVGLGTFLPAGATDGCATAITPDGAVIVGYCSSGSGPKAFVWDEVHGLQSLEELLVQQGSNLGGWKLMYATGISDSGTWICGYGTNPNGDTQAWVAVLRASPAVRQSVRPAVLQALDFARGSQQAWSAAASLPGVKSRADR